MFYIIVTEQDHQESFVAYSILPVKVWNVGAFRKDGPGDETLEAFGMRLPTLERYLYRGESWFPEIFSVFSICWLFVNEVWLWSFFMWFRNMFVFFHLKLLFYDK